MSTPTLELQIQSLPNNPGVYQYYDKEGKILYVGKAKNLKKRVASYFNKLHDNAKTNVLVKKIVEIKHIVVSSEADALLLENNLIKKLQPRYNVLLKDDKTYPWICIKKEQFSRIFPTRRMVKDGSEYFGPYTNFKTVNTILDLIKELYPLRTCNYDLSEANVKSSKYKVCLEYHLGNCKGPCEGYETLENYQKQVDAISEILKGNFKNSMRDFKKLMQELATEMKFEAAQKIK
jgi:excinuclease ABC subunit C